MSNLQRALLVVALGGFGLIWPAGAQTDSSSSSSLLSQFRDARDIAVKERLQGQMVQEGSDSNSRQLLQLARTTSDNDTRWMAIRGLGQLKFEPAAPFLIESLQSRERYVRANAARALGELRYVAAVVPLIHLLEGETDGGVIEQTSLALRTIKAVDALPVLKSRMSSGATQTLQTRCWLLDAIGGIGSNQDVPFVAQFLYDVKTNANGDVLETGVSGCAARAISALTGVDLGLPGPGLHDPVPAILRARAWWESHRDQLN